MIVNLIVLGLTATAAYFGYKKFIVDRLDSPQNNPAVKGLEKEEIKAAIKEGETKLKEAKEEVKNLEKERKDILNGSDADKGDKAKEKMDAKEEKLKELKDMETNLADLKIVDKGGYKAMMPNKLNWNNGMWLGGFLLGLGILYKILTGTIGYAWRSISNEQ